MRKEKNIIKKYVDIKHSIMKKIKYFVSIYNIFIVAVSNILLIGIGNVIGMGGEIAKV